MPPLLNHTSLRVQVVFWASGSKAVLGRAQRRLGALVLSERSVPVTDEQALPALLQVPLSGDVLVYILRAVRPRCLTWISHLCTSSMQACTHPCMHILKNMPLSVDCCICLVGWCACNSACYTTHHPLHYAHMHTHLMGLS